MTPDRVRDLIDAYGSAEHRWPVAERAEAVALLAADASLLAYQQEAAALDGLLDQLPQAEVPARLAESILADTAVNSTRAGAAGIRHPGPVAKLRGIVGQFLPDMPLWQPAAGLAASLVMGVWVGALGLLPLSRQPAEIDVAYYETTDGDMLSLIYGGGIGFGEWANDG